jgi:hypothetical protein
LFASRRRRKKEVIKKGLSDRRILDFFIYLKFELIRHPKKHRSLTHCRFCIFERAMAQPQHEAEAPPEEAPQDQAPGGKSEGKPESETFKRSWWTPQVNHALVDAAVTHDVWGAPRGQIDKYWTMVLQEFDSDCRVPSACHKRLKQASAIRNLKAILQAFERNDGTDSVQTGFGDEEFTEWHQACLNALQLRDAVDEKKADGNKKKDLQATLKRRGEDLRAAASRKCNRRASVKKDPPDSSSPDERHGGSTPLKPQALGSMAINFMSDASNRRAKDAVDKAARHKSSGELKQQQLLLQQQDADGRDQDRKHATEMQKKMVESMERQSNSTNAALGAMAAVMGKIADKL